MRRKSAAWALFLLLATAAAYGQQEEAEPKSAPPLGLVFQDVTERGRQLYAYDQAAWHGTDAFMALGPDTSGLGKYVCRKTAAGWAVLFGRLNEAQSKFLVVYESKQTSQPDKYEARKLSPPREETGYLLGSVLGIEQAFKDFKRENRPYNTAVLPGPDGNLYVYIYPGQQRDDVWPLGGDVRYTISPDGTRILEKRLLHKSILDLKFRTQDGKTPAGGYHTHVSSDVPEDTDVLFVLTRRPLIPEYIGTGKQSFIVNTDGSIQIQKK